VPAKTKIDRSMRRMRRMITPRVVHAGSESAARVADRREWPTAVN